MFCPKCGESNGDEAKFCRACGENLKVVAQAMTGRLPVALATRLDAYIERRNERLRRDGLGSFFLALCFILLGGYEVWKGSPFFGTSGVMLLFALFLLLVSAWDLMAYNRTLKPGSEHSDPLSINAPAADTRELPPRRATPAAAPASVTETTTRRLDPARTKDGQ